MSSTPHTVLQAVDEKLDPSLVAADVAPTLEPSGDDLAGQRPGTPINGFKTGPSGVDTPYGSTGHTPELLVNYFRKRLEERPTQYDRAHERRPCRARTPGASFQIFNIDNIPAPIQHEGQDVLRITLNTDSHVLLAYEGSPANSVPGHGEMTDPCIFAGNIYLNKEHEIEKINHKSGDFRPSFASIAFVLQVLANYPDKLASVVQIEELTDSGGIQNSFPINKDLLLGLAKPSLILAQPKDVITIITPTSAPASATAADPTSPSPRFKSKRPRESAIFSRLNISDSQCPLGAESESPLKCRAKDPAAGSASTMCASATGIMHALSRTVDAVGNSPFIIERRDVFERPASRPAPGTGNPFGLSLGDNPSASASASASDHKLRGSSTADESLAAPTGLFNIYDSSRRSKTPAQAAPLESKPTSTLFAIGTT